MPVRLDPTARDLIDGRPLTTLSTLTADGQVQSTIVFVQRDGDTVLFSTVKGRHKTRNMLRDPRITLLVLDTGSGRWVQIRGTVEITDDPQKRLLDQIYRRYLGAPPPPEPEAERVVVRVTPTSVFAFRPVPPAG